MPFDLFQNFLLFLASVRFFLFYILVDEIYFCTNLQLQDNYSHIRNQIRNYIIRAHISSIRFLLLPTS